jgi:uncharacterized protein (TIGR03083 family)
MTQNPPPVLVADRFPALLNTLLDLLNTLSFDDWHRPTIAENWTVQDIALHLLGDDVNILSGWRDGFAGPDVSITTWDELVNWIDESNNRWVAATRPISPRLICDLLRFTGDQVSAHFSSVDPNALGGVVSWASPDPAPVWLVLAREFTERWHHQQHIREAAGRPLLTEPYYLAPVLATFVRALPRTFQEVDGREGTCVSLTIIGDSGGSWSVVRKQGRWQLYAGKPSRPEAEVVITEDAAWRLFTKGISGEAARGQAILHGDEVLSKQMLRVVSIIA